MKTIIALIFAPLLAYNAAAQNNQDENKLPPATATTTSVQQFSPQRVKNLEDGTSEENGEINKGFGFGVSLGFNRIFDNLYDASISPVDSAINIGHVSSTSFVLSTTVSAPLPIGRKFFKRTTYETRLNGTKMGPTYFIPRGLYLVATVNILNFSEAGNGSVFNKKLDGGLGLGYRVNDDVLIACTYEMISVRQPRQFLLDKEGQSITVDNETLADLDGNDGKYFVDKYLPAFSIKLVYQIRGDKVKTP